jgi:acyl-CoA thioester hydrolase
MEEQMIERKPAARGEPVTRRTARASVSSPVNETRLRVRYAETDQMGVVYHSNHFVWFEVGRVELLRQLGFSYREMEREDGRYIAVAEAKCRYRAPVRYDDEVVVRTRLRSVRDSVIRFSYELLRVDDGSLLAEGETTHIVTDANMRMAELQAKYLKVFRAAMGKLETGVGTGN